MPNNQFSLLIAGDIMPVTQNVTLFEHGDIESLFGCEIINIFKDADYSIANLEGCLTRSEKKQEKAGPIIKATPESVKGLSKLGISAIALANNHITDANQDGLLDTIKTLDNANIEYVGVGTLTTMKSNVVIQTHLGQKICIYNVSETFFNEPTEADYGANIYDEYLVCNEIASLKKKCDYLFVIFHAGSEYFRYPTPDVKRKCHRMVDCGADLITTQHTHCVGCEEIYKGSYILYGQGNFCFGHHKAKERQIMTQKGILLRITISDNNIGVDKILVSLEENRYVRLDANQDFKEFDKRSEAVRNGKDFTDELAICKYNEIAEKYFTYYKGYNIYYWFLHKFFPSRYKAEIMKYDKRQILPILSTLGHSRRNEEFKIIFQYLLRNT